MQVREKDMEALEKIAEHEQTLTPDQLKLGWEWSNVGIHPALINKLLVDGLVALVYDSNRYKCYALTDSGRGILTDRNSVLHEQEAFQLNLEELTPDEMFAEIVGHKDVKDLIHASLCLDKPIHILLYGPPSIAKSLFLLCVERVCGPLAAWAAGSSTSKSGLQDLIAVRRPRILLLDELEKMSNTDLSVLLSIMEGGRLTRTKVGRELDERVDIRVIATANSIGRLPPELLDRFSRFRLNLYSPEEFVEVVRNVLVKREDILPDIADKIAKTLVGRTQSPRDAVRVARLSKKLGVERSIELLVRPPLARNNAPIPGAFNATV